MASWPGEGGWGAARAGRFSRLRAAGPASELHAAPLPDRPTVTFCDVARPAVVLGSTQPLADVDAERAEALGVDVVRRRSGGGAVFLAAGSVVWADVFVPAGDPLWEADVGRAFWWLGDAWAAALASLGAAGLSVHRGGLVRTRWSPKVCFAGLGPGEVSVDGAKVVGLSQRRTRAGALFQCACLLSWDPAPLVELLRLGQDAAADLAPMATGIGRPPADVERALLAAFD